MTACIVKKPSEEILGNILVNQEHSGKSGIIETGSMTEITVLYPKKNLKNHYSKYLST